MRNYYRMFGEWVHVVNSRGPAFDADCCAWGETKSALQGRIEAQIATAKAAIVASGFTATLQRHPATVYFELNKANFAILLNGWASPGGENAIWVWNGTALPKFSSFSDAYEDMTVFESPRKTWSHGD